MLTIVTSKSSCIPSAIFYTQGNNYLYAIKMENMKPDNGKQGQLHLLLLNVLSSALTPNLITFLSPSTQPLLSGPLLTTRSLVVL